MGTDNTDWQYNNNNQKGQEATTTKIYILIRISYAVNIDVMFVRYSFNVPPRFYTLWIWLCESHSVWVWVYGPEFLGPGYICKSVLQMYKHLPLAIDAI